MAAQWRGARIVTPGADLVREAAAVARDGFPQCARRNLTRHVGIKLAQAVELCAERRFTDFDLTARIDAS